MIRVQEQKPPQAIDEALLQVRRYSQAAGLAPMIIETSDRTHFFDARRDKAGVSYPSPVQAYLELASGDKRDKEVANDIRTVILRETAKAMS